MRTLKKALSLVLVLAMVFALAVPGFAADTTKKAADFKDYSKVTNKEAVDVLTAIGVINGNADGTFAPEGNFTRAEAATLITYLTLGKTVADALPTGATQFTDVPATHWAAKYVQYCAQEGIVAGVGNGKFDPDAKLTATQWALMLLGALGYKASNEGIGGTGWEIATTKLAMQAGVANASELTATFNRDMAAKMAFNALTATEVQYVGGSSVTVNGVTFTSGATRQFKTWANTTNSWDYNTGAATANVGDTIEFCEEHFNTLFKDSSTTTTNFLRPANVWKYTPANGAQVTVSAPATAKAVYTTAVTGKTVYSDLGLSAAPTTVNYTLNGGAASTSLPANAESGFAVAANNTKKVGGNGIVTEVYKINNTTLKIVQIQYTLGYVNNVVDYKATSAKGAYTTYTIDGVTASSNVYGDSNSAALTATVFSSVVNKTADVDTAKVEGTVTKGSYVLYVTDASDTVVGSTKMSYIYPVSTVEGALTASSATTYTIDGTAYSVANVTVAGGAASFASALYSKTNKTTFVLDTYGNVIAPVKAAAAALNYAYVAYAKDAWTLNGTTLNPSVTAYVVGTDGKIATMSVTKIGTSAVDGTSVDASDLTKGLYTYKLAKDGTTYEFTTAGQAVNSAFNYKTSPVLASGVAGNANTVFYTIKVDTDSTSTTYQQPTAVTTTTGMANMGNMTGVTGAYVANTNGVAEYVFIEAGSATAATGVVYYYGAYSFDGTDYIYKVLKNGEDTTMKSTTVPGTQFANGEGLYTVASNGAATAVAKAAYSSFTGAWTDSGKTYGMSNNGGLLTVTETVVATGVATPTANFATVADSVPVYTISAEANTVTVSTAADLNVAGASLIYVAANASADAIGAIYVVVA